MEATHGRTATPWWRWPRRRERGRERSVCACVRVRVCAYVCLAKREAREKGAKRQWRALALASYLWSSLSKRRFFTPGLLNVSSVTQPRCGVQHVQPGEEGEEKRSGSVIAIRTQKKKSSRSLFSLSLLALSFGRLSPLCASRAADGQKANAAVGASSAPGNEARGSRRKNAGLDESHLTSLSDMSGGRRCETLGKHAAP